MNFRSQEIYKKAWNFASIKHKGQTYGGAEQNLYIEYLNHIGSVAAEIMWTAHYSDEKFDANLAVQCAVLHDTVEDTETTCSEIAEIFGQDVAAGVKALTKDKKLKTKQLQMSDSLRRIKNQPKEIAMVKLADRITNLYEPPFYWNTDKISKYREEAQIIWNELNYANKILSERLKYKIREYKKFDSVN